METSGYKGWWPMQQPVMRDRHGAIAVKEVFANVVTGEVYSPEKGWSGEPPYPTGEIVRAGMGGTDEFWEEMTAHRHETRGEVVSQGEGRTVIKY